MKKQFKLRVVAKEQENSRTSTKFLAFSTPMKNGGWCTVKFSKNCNEVPKKTCDIITDNIFMTNKDGRMIAWINSIKEIDYNIMYQEQDLSVFFEEIKNDKS